MDDGLKQRLIGAFVLFALAVIFVPLAFDRERIEPVDKTSQVPPAPEIEVVRIEKAKPPEVESSADEQDIAGMEIEAPTPDESFLPDEDEPQNLEPEPVSFAASGAPNSWVLQVGSFRSTERAEKLRDQLIADGHAAYVRHSVTDKGEMTRVFVGPKLEKAVLLQSKEKIEEKYKLSALLLKFEP